MDVVTIGLMLASGGLAALSLPRRDPEPKHSCNNWNEFRRSRFYTDASDHQRVAFDALLEQGEPPPRVPGLEDVIDSLLLDSDLMVGSEHPDDLCRIAYEWLELGFDGDDVQEWGEAGVFLPDRAAMLRDAGIDPDYVPTHIGKLFANGELEVEGIEALLPGHRLRGRPGPRMAPP